MVHYTYFWILFYRITCCAVHTYFSNFNIGLFSRENYILLYIKIPYWYHYSGFLGSDMVLIYHINCLFVLRPIFPLNTFLDYLNCESNHKTFLIKILQWFVEKVKETWPTEHIRPSRQGLYIRFKSLLYTSNVKLLGIIIHTIISHHCVFTNVITYV